MGGTERDCTVDWERGSDKSGGFPEPRTARERATGPRGDADTSRTPHARRGDHGRHERARSSRPPRHHAAGGASLVALRYRCHRRRSVPAHPGGEQTPSPLTGTIRKRG